nr:MAG TPA: Protein of unknown function (DUF3102) [Caudoviricetes sp.]
MINDFDYSVLDVTTKEFLEERANIIYGIQNKSAYEIGKQLAQAQEKLSAKGYGCFEEWYRGLGFKTTKAYEYINHFKFVSSQNEESKIEMFERLPKALQAQVSKPSASPEVNQAVFDGDVKTRKEYKELENKLKLSQQANELLRGENEALKASKVEVRETIKEVVPDDYRTTRELNKRLLLKNQELSDSMKAIEERSEFINNKLNEMLAQREEVDKKSAQYDELTRAIEESQGQLNNVQKQISAYKNITSLLQKGNDFLASMGGLIYADEKNVLKADGIVRDEFDSFISRGLRFFNDLNDIRKENNILEGEFE